MKFLIPSFKIFLNGRTNRQMDAHTDKPKAICSSLFLSWGHKNNNIKNTRKNLPLKPSYAAPSAVLDTSNFDDDFIKDVQASMETQLSHSSSGPRGRVGKVVEFQRS